MIKLKDDRKAVLLKAKKKKCLRRKDEEIVYSFGMR